MTKFAEGALHGSIAAAAVAAYIALAGESARPMQQQTVITTASWIGLASWAARRPGATAEEAVIASAIIVSCVNLAARAATWTTNRIAVTALETERKRRFGDAAD